MPPETVEIPKAAGEARRDAGRVDVLEADRAQRERQLVVVANRLPTQRVGKGADARWELSPGGLVSALAPALAKRGGVWVGWSGDAGAAPDPFRTGRIQNVPVSVSRREYACFYEGFANRTIWPMYHDAVREPVFDRRWWDVYIEVNRRFAQAAAATADDGADVWVHDYQLQLVPALLRELRPDVRIGFFMHIPFPPVEIFSRLPWRSKILAGLLGADVVGFQTVGDAANFRRAARDALPVELERDTVRHAGREIVARAFPISIDAARQQALASSAAIAQAAQRVRESVGVDRQILLGVDRLDYTKGIEQRLCAYRLLLRTGRARIDRQVLVQIAPPSRENVREYREARKRIEGLVGEINGEFGEVGRVAVHYLRRSLKPDRLAAFFRAADVMLVTPLRDGMNLVAKEYVVSRVDGTGALLLSRFAGAARELTDAVICNPHDIAGLADDLHQAMTLAPNDAAQRMERMRAAVFANDVHHWTSQFLETMSADSSVAAI